MKFSALTFIALAASSVYGSVIDVTTRDAADSYVDLETRATCYQSDMQAIKDRINHYNVFCQAFNARPNDQSPLPTLTSAKLSAACSCLISQWNKQANPTSVPNTLSMNSCAASDTSFIKKEAPRNFQSYCRWWGLASRSTSAVPGVSVAQLSKSCKCLLGTYVASTAVKVTTTSKAAATSAPACKKRRKVRRTVTVEVPAQATAEPTPSV